MAEDVTQQVPPQAPLASLREGFSKLSNNQKIGLMLGVALVVAMVVGLLLWVQTPGYRILWPGETIPPGAEEFYDRTKSWLPCERIGHRVREDVSLHNLVRYRAVRVPVTNGLL